MKAKVTNRTEYDSREVARLVRRTLKEMECPYVEVTVKHRRDNYASGRYYAYYYPQRGQRGHQITVALPRPGIPIKEYHPYSRKGEEGKAFPLDTWQEALIAIVAHEGNHHNQAHKRRRYAEVECDLAAYRAWKRHRDRGRHTA